MTRHLLFVIAAASALGGCCGLGSVCFVPPPPSKLTSWDGLGPYPKRDHRKVAKVRKISDPAKSEISPNERELAALKPYSKEWWVVRQALDRGADDKLAKRMIICRGCLPSEVEYPTGSIDNFRRAPVSLPVSETAPAQASSCQ
jgi:hypothetical protein